MHDGFSLSQRAHLAFDPAAQPASDGRRGKVFNDPVHGHIFLSGLCCDVIDTAQFQRLRDLKQLGLTYLVFPGASHNRFEHSLGTGHLANSVHAHIVQLQGRELGVDRHDGEVVALAGLCHDLGHGPFSHVFDNEFLPRRHGSSYDPGAWSHEAMSASMLEYLVDDNHIDTTAAGGEDLLRRVKALITSDHGGGGGGAGGGANGALLEKGYLKEIVANGRNSVDVDKFDYIQRDCLNCGLKNSADFARLVLYMKVLGDEICFKASEVLNLYELFHTRASLHQRVYTHRKAKAMEYMVVDALVEADAAWDNEISKSVWTPEDFLRVDDTILKRIEFQRDPALRGAQALLGRLRRRELYRYVNEFTVPSSRLARWTDVTPADIVACQGASGAGWVAGGLRPEDVVVHNLKIDWAKGAKNPVDHVSFYDDYGSQDKFHIPKEKVSSLIPDVFQERKVRVYSKNADSRFVEAVDAAFDAYQRREYGGLASQHRTPSKPSRKRAAPGDADGATAATTPACAASQPGAGGGRGGGGGGGGGGGTGGGLAGAAAAAAAGGAAAGLRSVVAALAFSAAVGEGGTPSWPTS